MRWKNKESNITFHLYPARRLPMLAPPRRQSLDSPPGHANRACSSPEGTIFPKGPLFPEGLPGPRRPCPSSPAGSPLFLPTGAALRQRAPVFPEGSLPAARSPIQIEIW